MAGSSLGRRTRIALALFACIPAWLSLPGSAAAATVQLAKKTAVSYGDGWAGIDYRAAPGEVNRVLLDEVDGMTIRVADTGAVIAPGRGCRALDAHAAQCSVAGMRGYNGLIAANVRAGDMDDTVDSRGPGAVGERGTRGRHAAVVGRRRGHPRRWRRPRHAARRHQPGHAHRR